jgi:hypothetical protein
VIVCDYDEAVAEAISRDREAYTEGKSSFISETFFRQWPMARE